MPASAIEVSFCGAAATASASPASAALIAARAKASEARPLAAPVVPNSSSARSGCAQSSTLRRACDHSASAGRAIACRSAAMPQAAACRCSTPASPTRSGLHAARTAGSRAALRLISGPMPAGSPTAMAMVGLSSMRGPASISLTWSAAARAFSLPGHERGVDHVRNTLAADRPDGKVHIFEAEPVGRDFLQREALRGKLRQRELARLEAVPARALDGDELHGDFFQREIGELLHLALDHDGSTLALERFDAEQNRNRPGAGGAIERHVDALAARDLHDARERIFLLDVDGEVGAELPRDLHAHAVLGGAGD